MSTEAYGLQDIKKELQHLGAPQLNELLLRLARYKKENKELLAYLLFTAHDEDAFLEQAKYEVGMMFYLMPSQAYNAVKLLRKILRYIGKLVRFSGSKNVEIKLLLTFCSNYLEYTGGRTTYKPLRTVFIRQVEKIYKTIDKLHDDLQGDHLADLSILIEQADNKLSWFDKQQFKK